MRPLLIGIALLTAYGVWNAGRGPEPLVGLIAPHDRVIMYSLTTCGYCREKARALRAAGIAFQEYYIDIDASRRQELNRKLMDAGLPPAQYGTPILDVHGALLPNNPDLATIREYLSRKAGEG